MPHVRNRASSARPRRLLEWPAMTWVFALLGMLWLSGPAAAPSERTHLVVLHTNDLHGQVQPLDGVGGLPEVAACIEGLRAREGPSLLLLDGGDWFQGTVEGRAEEGAGFVSALRAVPYDALVVGNHEFDLGLDALRRVVALLGDRAVCANVFESDGRRPPWARPYRIVEREGLRIAVVGFVSRYTPEIVPRDARSLEFRDPVEVFGALREELRKAADLVLVLTHQGVGEDRRLAEAFPELPLIVGGHSHSFLQKGLRKGATLIVQAGSRARSVGRVDLWLESDEEGKMRVVESESQLISLRDASLVGEVRNEVVDTLCEELSRRAEAEMGTVVGRLAGPLERSRGLVSSSAGNWVSDLLREYGKADVGLHNKGGLRADVPVGDVSRRMLFEMLPFQNTVVVLELPGAVLRGAVRSAVEVRRHAGLEFSGMEVALRRAPGGGFQLEEVRIGGEPIEPERVYRVATNSFLADGGDGYFEPAQFESARDTETLLWELAEWGLRGDEPVLPDATERYRSVD